MGNRAAIAIRKTKGSPAIYLHWNGGPESVLAFLHAAKALKVRSPESDPDYCLGRLAQIIGNFFGGTTSMGIGRVGHVDDSDNGTYFIGGDFEIKSRTQGEVKTVDGLNKEEKDRYVAMRDQIIEFQTAAFDDSDYMADVVITRVRRSRP